MRMVLEMEHLNVIRQSKNGERGSLALQTKASGQYFTPEVVGRKLAQDVLRVFSKNRNSMLSVNVVDPFCGDGRLVVHHVLPVSLAVWNPNSCCSTLRSRCAVCNDWHSRGTSMGELTSPEGGAAHRSCSPGEKRFVC